MFWLLQLVYLYLINYAKSQPELTLLAVNTFVKDAKVRTSGLAEWDHLYSRNSDPCVSCAMRCNSLLAQDPNPLIRALAVRTMGCIRVDKVSFGFKQRLVQVDPAYWQSSLATSGWNAPMQQAQIPHLISGVLSLMMLADH